MIALGKVMLYHSGMTTPEPIAIRRAVELLGSQLALAKALGVTPVTVNQWVRPSGANSSRPVPPKQCVRIELLTAGRVSRRELRPADWRDIWPELLAQDPAL
jgi:DNA-binding transcriptional regulator YdaS (Cro superfamily)